MEPIRIAQNTSWGKSAQVAAEHETSSFTFDEERAGEIPEELRQTPRWVLWRYEHRKGKRTKVPKVPASPARNASTDKPETWGSFDEAIEAWRDGSHGCDGIGFVLSGDDDGILGLDLDDVRDASTGELLPQARHILEAIPEAYAEISPSGTGLKLWMRASLPGITSRREHGKRNGRAGIKVKLAGEALSTGEPIAELFATKYFTMTASTLEDRPEPRLGVDVSDALADQLDRFAPQWRGRLGLPAPSSIVEVKAEPRRAAGPIDIGDRIEAARAAMNNGTRERFDALWAGDRMPSHPSDSEADFNLARLLAEAGFDTPGELERALNASPRMAKRPKLSRPDYLASTIENALAVPAEPRDRMRLRSGAGGSGETKHRRDRAPLSTVVIPETGLEIELTDMHIGSAFAEEHGERLRYDHTRGRWLRLHAGVWRPDDDEHTRHEIAAWCQQLADLAEDQHPEEPPARLAKLRERLCSIQRRLAVEQIAKADRAVAVTASVWDRDPMLAGTPEGVLDIATGELRPATGEEHITRSLGVAPAAPGTGCETWTRFLAESMEGDADLVAFLQRFAGYVLTGSTREHALVFMHGAGGNGKSVFLNTLTSVLGDYAGTAQMETFTERSGSEHSCELAALAGARFVIASETQEGRYWAESRIKQLSGGDPITARFMRRDPFTFRPSFKLAIAGNHRPRLKNPGPSIARRMHLVPWNNRPANPDQHLEARLMAEAPAILRWMLDGARMWLDTGLAPPARVLDETAQYLRDEDDLGTFLEDRVEVDPDRAHHGEEGLFTPTKWLVEEANAYRARNGDDRPVRDRDLAVALHARGARQYVARQSLSGRRVRGWLGVRVFGREFNRQ